MQELIFLKYAYSLFLPFICCIFPSKCNLLHKSLAIIIEFIFLPKATCLVQEFSFSFLSGTDHFSTRSLAMIA